MINVIRALLSMGAILLLFFGLSYWIAPQAFKEYPLWILVISTLVIFLTQPPIRKGDFSSREDGYSMLGIMVMAIVVTNLTCIDFCLFTFPDYGLGVINVLGLFMIIGGITFRIYAIRKLAGSFSNPVQVGEGHTLYREGIYAFIRHPSYLGAVVGIVGNIVWLESWKTAPLSFLLIFMAYRYRIRQEEKALITHFGEKYQNYRRNTGALLPPIKTLVKK